MREFIQDSWASFSDWAVAINIVWTDVLVAAIIMAVAVALAVVFVRIVFRRALRLFIFFGPDFDVRMAGATRVPATATILLVGTYLAIRVLALPSIAQGVVDKLSVIGAILIVSVLVNSVASVALQWLQVRMSIRGGGDASGWALPLARRGIAVVVVAIGAMLSLDILGINVTPLIAGLGIGGLAVALALQPTLSNLFAGTYVVSEGVVGVGDYVEMENGVSGYVVDVSWRSTRLRTWTNNLVVIPNSRFAESTITNYNQPDEPVNVFLPCGVAYESDLERVEAVSHEVMDEVLRDHPGAVLDYGAYFGYDAFGESNVEFWLFVQARDRLAGFEVRSELVKQLHARLAAEGITINYPVRTLRFPEGWTAWDGAQPWGGVAAARPAAAPGPRAPLPADAPGGDGDGPDV